MKMNKQDAWAHVKSYLDLVKLTLKTKNVRYMDFTVMLAADGNARVNWGNTTRDVPDLFDRLQPAPASPPAILSALVNTTSEFDLEFFDTEMTTREAIEVAIENLAIFAQATSGANADVSVDIFGSTEAEAEISVLIEGPAIAFGWNPPEADDAAASPQP